jgi:hypothetical protein
MMPAANNAKTKAGTKKRGRPEKVNAEVSETTERKKNLSWTTKMENKLMELRLSKYIDQFTYRDQ